MNHRMTNFFKTLCIFFLLGLLSMQSAWPSNETGAVISAQEGVSIQLDATVGFDGAFRSQIPTPVRVEIFNGAESFFHGKAVIKTKNWIPPAVYSHKVDIPPGETKILNMYIYEGKISGADVTLLNERGVVVQKKTVGIHVADLLSEVIILSISENSNDFKFLSSLSMQRFWAFKSAPLMIRTDRPRKPNLSYINVAKEIPPHLSNNLTAWNSISSVFCDLRSYINLSPDVKTHLKAWVNLGGELLLYPPDDNLNENEIEIINNDSFLQFKILGFTSSDSAVDDKYQLIIKEKTGDIFDVEYSSTTLVYEFGDKSLPLIGSMVSKSGGITLFRFPSGAMNPEKLEEWVEILFQLGLLSPFSYQAGLQSSFNEIVLSRTVSGSHVKTDEERITNGIYQLGLKYLITLILPLIFIVLIGKLFLRINKKMIFLYYILPGLLITFVGLPFLLVPQDSFDSRMYEAYHLINLSEKNQPAFVNSNYVIEKAFPQSGKLKIECPDGFTIYDEMVSRFLGKHPTLEMDCTPPGTITTNEITPEMYRQMMASSENSKIGSIDSVFRVLDGVGVEFEITNNTNLKLMNCGIVPYNMHLESLSLPRVLPDMNPGQTVKGIIKGRKDDATENNAKIREFIGGIDGGIFSFAAREELFFELVSMANSSAYNVNRPFQAYMQVAQFFASTTDYSTNMMINGETASGSEVGFILAKLDVEYPDDYVYIHTRNISTLFPDAPNQFVPYWLDNISGIGYSGAFYGLFE